MTNEKMAELLQGIKNVSDLKGVKFAYAMAKNRKMIEKEIETLQEAVKPKKKFQEYDKKRVELCERYAEKDDKGKPKMEGSPQAQEYLFSPENKKKFDKNIEKLKEEYKKEMDEREAQIKEFNELVKKESDYKPFKVAFADVPEEITTENMNGIVELIEDPK